MFNRQALTPGLLLAAAFACGGSAREADSPKTGSLQVPEPPMVEKRPHEIKTPNGTRIDPYFWLRDDSRKDPEVLAYLEAENDYSDKRLAEVAELRATLEKEIIGRIKQDDSSVPVYDNGYWYYTRYEKAAEYPIHARKKGSTQEPEQILLDVSELAKAHKFYSVGGYDVSPDGNMLAFAEDTVGRRQYKLRFKNLATGEVLEDEIENISSFTWTGDNRTVVYVKKHETTLLPYLVKAHSLGSPTASDRELYEEKDETFSTSVRKSKSRDYLFLDINSTLSSEVRFARADDPSLTFKAFLPREKEHEYSLMHLGDSFIIRSNWRAKNFRIMMAGTGETPDKLLWTELVPHQDDVFIHGFDVFEDFLVTSERADGLRKLHVRPWPRVKEGSYMEADEPAYAMYLGANHEIGSKKLRYSYSSLRTPRTIYELDTATGKREVLKQDPVLGGFDSSDYVVEYLSAPARDGESIPISIVRHKDTKRDGSAPIYQYGYGSYGISMDPTFRSTIVSLLDRGFVFAIAHIRGGQEKGRRWYEDGRQLKKKNTFHDFIDVTKYLVAEKIGAADKIFAAGGSAGGLLVGAVANMAPELYRGIIAWVPFVDVVTTMLDEDIPLTTGEFDEWGNPKEKTSYDYMLSYSPYDNVKEQAYPAMLVVTGLWDSQVQYFEPAKWVAKLRDKKTDNNPLLMHTNMEAGHGGKSGRFQRYKEVARDYAFVLWVLGLSS